MNCISQDNCNTSTLTLNHQKLKVQSATPKEFVARDGPFVHAVEDALQNCGVQRQAYHGGSFVGNHVHACLKVGPTHTFISPMPFHTSYMPWFNCRPKISIS